MVVSAVIEYINDHRDDKLAGPMNMKYKHHKVFQDDIFYKYFNFTDIICTEVF